MLHRHLKRLKARYPELAYWYARQRAWIKKRLVSDKNYVMRKHLDKFGVLPDLDNPKTFNEQEIKLIISEPTPLMTLCADKYAVRSYVEKKAGKAILNDLYGVFSDFESLAKAIPNLPERFVVKATHGASWNYICKDKAKIDLRDLRAKVNHWLKSNFYYAQREKVYRDIPPRIICEKYLEDESGGLTDYKVYCHYGEPKYYHVIVGRYTDQILNTYDTQGSYLPIEFRVGLADPGLKVNPNLNLEEMLGYSRKLSSELDYVRVDFYFVDNRIIFGELTFTSGNGHILLPREQDLMLGSYFERSS